MRVEWPSPPDEAAPSVTVVVPCRNERGTVRALALRVPPMGSATEIVFVDGDSTDGTVEEVEGLIRELGGRLPVRLLHQAPPGSGPSDGRMLPLGKGDAVRRGFAEARGSVLMILDADLTVDPEVLSEFYAAIAEGRAELAIGNRLVLPMERGAMRGANRWANRLFARLVGWVAGRPIADALCGAKAIRREAWERIARAGTPPGDPFGDFDIVLGAAREHLAMAEIPVRYRRRVYGREKIRPLRHGLALLGVLARWARLRWLRPGREKARYVPPVPDTSLATTLRQSWPQLALGAVGIALVAAGLWWWRAPRRQDRAPDAPRVGSAEIAAFLGDLRVGTPVGPCTVAQILPEDGGALPIVLLGPEGERHLVHLHRRDPRGPPAPAEKGTLAVYVVGVPNGSPTPEHLALGMRALAEALDAAGARAPRWLGTLRERSRASAAR